jgi:hypothetical protein
VDSLAGVFYSSQSPALVVLLDYRATDKQTQPNAVWFGREERFEHRLLGIDPRAGIFDTDNHPILQMLGTDAGHVRTICDGGHGVGF